MLATRWPTVQGDLGKSIARFDRRPMSRATDPIDE